MGVCTGSGKVSARLPARPAASASDEAKRQLNLLLAGTARQRRRPALRWKILKNISDFYKSFDLEGSAR
jgi:hypothetical protein